MTFPPTLRAVIAPNTLTKPSAITGFVCANSWNASISGIILSKLELIIGSNLSVSSVSVRFALPIAVESLPLVVPAIIVIKL